MTNALAIRRDLLQNFDVCQPSHRFLSFSWHVSLLNHHVNMSAFVSSSFLSSLISAKRLQACPVCANQIYQGILACCLPLFLKVFVSRWLINLSVTSVSLAHLKLIFVYLWSNLAPFQSKLKNQTHCNNQTSLQQSNQLQQSTQLATIKPAATIKTSCNNQTNLQQSNQLQRSNPLQQSNPLQPFTHYNLLQHCNIHNILFPPLRCEHGFDFLHALYALLVSPAQTKSKWRVRCYHLVKQKRVSNHMYAYVHIMW